MIYMLIKDEYYNRNYGILGYNHATKEFIVFLRTDKDEWQFPILLDDTIRVHHTHVIPPEYAKLWVENRIVPPERQNIDVILRNIGILEYDEFEVLHYGRGKCCQDKMYLVDIDNKQAEYYAKKYGIDLNNKGELEKW